MYWVALMCAAAVLLAYSQPSLTSFFFLASQLVLTGIVLQLERSFVSTKKRMGFSGKQNQREYQLMLESIQQCPMPYAIYDEKDRLCVWNKPYEEINKHYFEQLKNPQNAKGSQYAAMIRHRLPKELSAKEARDFVEARVKEQRREGCYVNDQQYQDIGWFRVTKYQTPSGGLAGFGVDINELKQRQTDLIKEIEHRKELEVEIRKVANTDALTGIPNRRYFIEDSERMLSENAYLSSTMSLLMIDIDYFKNINDTYGHAAGDEVITEIAHLISDKTKPANGLPGRLGGEEFAVLLPDTNANEAEAFAHGIRKAIGELEFKFPQSHFNITVSIGLVTCSDESTYELTKLMKLADDALYLSKHNGRDIVSVSGRDRLLDMRKTS